MSKRFVYKADLKWGGTRRGTLSGEGKSDIGISTPPEFKGEKGFWSPEELLVSAVNSCIMTTFLYYAEKKNLEIQMYTSKAEGILENVDKKFMFSKITVKPRILPKNKDQINVVEELMDLAENNCFISNSVKAEVKVMLETG